MVNSRTNALTIFVICVLTVSFSVYASTPEQILNEGLSYQAKGQYDKAIKKFKKVIKDKPNLHTSDYDNRSVMGLLALSYVYNMEADSAINVAKQALGKDPNDWVALGSLGMALILKREFVTAKEYFKQAVSIRPGAWQVYDCLASVYLIEKDLETALSTLEESIDIYPKNIVSRNWIVVIECLKGNKKNAIREFKTALYDIKLFDIMAMFKHENNINSLYLSLNSIFKEDLDTAALELQKYTGKKAHGINFLLGIICLFNKDRNSAIELFRKETEVKGLFCFLSNIYLACLYAYAEDVNNFIKSQSSIPKSLN